MSRHGAIFLIFNSHDRVWKSGRICMVSHANGVKEFVNQDPDYVLFRIKFSYCFTIIHTAFQHRLFKFHCIGVEHPGCQDQVSINPDMGCTTSLSFPSLCIGIEIKDDSDLELSLPPHRAQAYAGRSSLPTGQCR